MENLNDLMGINTPESSTQQNSQNYQKKEINKILRYGDKYSDNLRSAASVINIIMYICIAAAVIGGIVYLVNIGDVDSSYSHRAAKAVIWSGIASSIFSYGIGGTFMCYVIKNILMGISVIAEASEKYLRNNLNK